MSILSARTNGVLRTLFLLAIMVTVALNICTPLRLNTDTVRYLNIMEFLDGKIGAEPYSFAAYDFLPRGYPYLLLLLEKAGLLSSAAIVLINVFFLFAAAVIFCCVLHVKDKRLFIAFNLLSFISVKHMTMSLADPLFVFLLSAACFYWKMFFVEARRYIVPALIVTAFSLYVRTAGIVIPIGIVCYLVYVNRQKVFGHFWLKFCFYFLLAAALGFFFSSLDILEEQVTYLEQLGLRNMIVHPVAVWHRITMHLQEMGEQFVNIPASQLSSLLHLNIVLVQAVFIALGIYLLVVLAIRIVRTKLIRQPTCWIMLAYLAMIFVWPYYDTRFLMPLIPFILYLLFPFFNTWTKTSPFSKVHAAIFLVFGILALGYSTLLSTNKEQFLTRYGNSPELSAFYRSYFEGKPLPGPVPQATDQDPDRLLYLLYMYDK